jgi:hypothetical protein
MPHEPTLHAQLRVDLYGEALNAPIESLVEAIETEGGAWENLHVHVDVVDVHEVTPPPRFVS